MSAIFTYKEFWALLTEFAATLPQLLGKVPATAHLVKDVDQLLDSADSPFTVAVLGQMRSGKSTLLNALMGRDLAVVGDEETTATTNWFKYTDVPELAESFNVHWREPPAGSAPQETVPLSEITRWTGDSVLARSTRYLEFFAPSPFLKEANIVDTPGTRSVIHDHTDKVLELISGTLAEKERYEERLADESKRQARGADAIVYVLMSLERQNDLTWLEEFERLTRTPGTHPFNSIGVVHKWETVFDSRDAWARVQKKTEQMRRAFLGTISCLIPVSAPLGILAERLKDDSRFWSELLRLGRDSTPESIEFILYLENYFLDDVQGCSLTSDQRRALWNRILAVYPGLPWATLQVLVRSAQDFGHGGGEELRRRVFEMSGMPRLKAELSERYFARSKMIKAFSILSKAWLPCQSAQTILRNRKVALSNLIGRARESSALLRARIGGGESDLVSVLGYVVESLETIEAEFRQASDVLRTLSNTVVPIRDAFDDMKRDLEALSCLAEGRTGFGPEDAARLKALFGGDGPEVAERVGPFSEIHGHPTLREVERAIEYVSNMTPVEPTESTRLIQESALIRLGQVADWIEDHLAG